MWRHGAKDHRSLGLLIHDSRVDVKIGSFPFFRFIEFSAFCFPALRSCLVWLFCLILLCGIL